MSIFGGVGAYGTSIIGGICADGDEADYARSTNVLTHKNILVVIITLRMGSYH